MVVVLKRLVAVAAIIVFVVSALLLTSPKSHADSPGYVTYTEFLTSTRGTMSEMERAWGVVGDGQIVSSRDHGQHIIKEYHYAWNWYCTGSVAQVAYDLNKAGQYMSNSILLYIWQPDPLSKVTCE